MYFIYQLAHFWKPKVLFIVYCSEGVKFKCMLRFLVNKKIKKIKKARLFQIFHNYLLFKFVMILVQ